MELETEEFKDGWGFSLVWICAVSTDKGDYSGRGPTEDAAKIDALAKAAEESDEARAELGILIGVRGGRRPGRPRRE